MTEQNKPNISNQKSTEEDEIDLIQLTKTLWNGRKTVIKTTLIFMAMGLFIAIFSPKEYTASTTFVPQTKDSKIGGNLGGLAAMAGINLGSIGGDSGISPELYPQIINSIPFQLELLQTPLTIEGQEEKVTYTDYYTSIHSPGLFGYIKKYTIGLPGLIISAIKGKPKSMTDPSSLIPEIQSITIEEYELIKQLKDQIELDVNDKDDYVSVSANMPEAIASAQLAEKAQSLLQQYIINFKIQKSSEQLKFIKDRYTEKELDFKSIQQELARFRDRNQNVNSALAQTTLERLQSEYDLAYGVYYELAKQLEAQQIQFKEDTPVFMVLKPVTSPFKKSKPKRVTILIVCTFLGVIVGGGMVFGKVFLNSIKNSWDEQKD